MNRKLAKRKAHVKRRQIYQSKRISKKEYLGYIPTSRFNNEEFVDLPAPAIFNLQHKNCVGVINYINLIKKNARRGKNIIINLEKVTLMGEGAITMLLSVMQDVEKKGTKFKGAEPEEPKALKVLLGSGFFKMVRSERRPIQDNTSKNVLRAGKRKTSSKFLGEEIRKAMETVWGVKGRNPYVRTNIFEMMRNSADHAFEKVQKTTWYLSISHEEETNLVKFSFVDNGQGIIETMARSRLKKFLDLFQGSTDMLETAFTNGIESRTGLPWRGQGLPTIFESYQDGFVKNFLVISNDAFIHFDKEIKMKLPNAYKGTYYYWEVDRSCKKACFE